MEAVIHILGVLPRNLLSYLVGCLVRIRLPKPLNEWANRQFVQFFKIDMAEAEFPLTHYETIEDVFTRRLKEGVREIEAEVCSPADGMLSVSQAAQNNEALQVKGITYSLEELMFAGQPNVEFGWFSTIYLAPHNYHRVHSPISGELTEVRYFPGDLWPVNQAAVKNIPGLFIRNERLVFTITQPDGSHVYLAMVGAFNVGRMQANHAPNFFTNQWPRRVSSTSVSLDIIPTAVKAGEELGVFMLGSTVVIGWDKRFLETHRVVQTSGNQPIMMGQSLLQKR